MKDAAVGGYRRARRGLSVLGVAAALLGTVAGGALADGYGDAKQIGGDEYEYGYSTYATEYKGDVYQYETGKDGNAYYSTYDGKEWADWKGWDDQPVKYKYDPAPASYKDGTYVCYTGEDGYIYYNWYDGSDWSGWAKIGDEEYKFDSAPYGYAKSDYFYLYATGEDGYVYYNQYDGTDWTGWANISGESKAKYEP